MDRTTLTRNIKPLQKQGLLRITSGKADGREREVTLTGRGEAFLAKALPLWNTVQQKVEIELGQERVNRLLRDLSATVEVAQEE